MMDRKTVVTEMVTGSVFSVETEVTLGELIHSSNDEFLWDIASTAVSLHTGRMVVVSQPEYTPIRVIEESKRVRLRIDCYIE